MQKYNWTAQIMIFALAASFSFIMVACHHHAETKAASQPVEGQVFVGLASYYGVEMGPQTASGAKFDPNAMSAAHRTLPFGTRVMVTNLENNRSVIVTITDRGPQKKDRLIDVSFAAAKELDMLTVGVVKVRVEVVHD
jgi:rare lipoprotein A